MVLITQSGSETLPIGSPAPAFPPLPATDGKKYNLDSFAGSKAYVVSFTCNHCPYAKAYENRFMALAREFSPQGVAFIAVNSNDATNYPDDNFENMKMRAKEKKFPFPYLHDETQQVARSYGAVCTPHIFLMDAGKRIVYEGRLDDNWKDPSAVKSQDLRLAIEAVLADKPVPVAQTNPMGCSIKWK